MTLTTHTLIMTRLRTIIILTLGFFTTLLFEIIFNSFIQSSSPKRTLLEHIQSSLTSAALIAIILLGLTFFILFMGLLMIGHDHGIFIIYITLLKFFELFPLLIDLINLLFIYQYKMKDINEQNSSNRPNLTFIFASIRLIICLDVVRRKCDSKSKKQILIILDFLLFILVNITLIRYSNFNRIRIVQKIILGLLIFQLNDLFYNETFWTHFTKSNEHIKDYIISTILLNHIQIIFRRLNIVYLILYIRWILSSFIICLFIFFTFQSIIIDQSRSLFSLEHVYIFLKSYRPILVVCMVILYVIRRDTLHNQNGFKRYGISYYCIGLDLKATEISSPITSNVLLMKECLVCNEDKDFSEFDGLVFPDCQHLERSVCNICLFDHIQNAFQITFTDDISCPELNCGVKFSYDTVRNILLSNGDNKLVERYDRYVFQRQLEQMDEFIWCSNPLCNVGQLNDGDGLNNIVTCFNCHQKTCFIHKVKWHEGITCEEYDWTIDPDYESSRRWIVENSKKCPNCPYQIEKSDGCDHIICTKCRHEFCWSCLADFQPIRQHGNHRHKSICKHYVLYDEE